MSFETQFNTTAKNMLDMQKRLMDIGNDHIKGAGNDDVQAATRGRFGRFCNWAASFFTSSASNASKDAVSALYNKICGTSSLGSEYAEVFKGKADALLTGAGRWRPLSGRQIGHVLQETINQAKEAYIQTAIQKKEANDSIQNQLKERLELFPTYYKSGGAHMLKGFAMDLGFSPDSHDFPAIADKLLPKVLEKLTNQMDEDLKDGLAFQKEVEEHGSSTQAVILSSVMTCGLTIMKETLKEAAVEMYLRSLADGLMNTMRTKHNLGDMNIDSEAFFKAVFTPVFASLRNVETLNSQTVDAALYTPQDPTERLENRLASFANKLLFE
jgi:hypothetical protein